MDLSDTILQVDGPLVHFTLFYTSSIPIVGELVVSVITELCIAYTVFYIAVFGYAYMLGILCQRDV